MNYTNAGVLMGSIDHLNEVGFRMTQVYLVPGFLGFTELGSFNYFHRVSDVLGEALQEHFVDAEIIEVDTVPTGSIRRRAARLLGIVREHGGLKQDHIHFIGHSTGGLDVRMLLTPGVQLFPTQEEIAIADRTRSAITLSTPHYGTPLANICTSMNGRTLLYILTLLATSGPGRYALYVAARYLSTIARFDRLLGQRENILDSLAENLLKKLSPKRGDALWEFIRDISRDQGAMIQLTPESMDLFNAATLDRENVEYVCFVSASPPPSPRSFIISPRNLYRSVTHAIYATTYAITSREHPQYPYPTPEGAVFDDISTRLGFTLNSGTNDGVVPALSQIRGRLGSVVIGDHLDVVGQFRHTIEDTVYSTWLYSGSGFNEQRFRKLWSDIAAVIAKAQS